MQITYNTKKCMSNPKNLKHRKILTSRNFFTLFVIHFLLRTKTSRIIDINMNISLTY